MYFPRYGPSSGFWVATVAMIVAISVSLSNAETISFAFWWLLADLVEVGGQKTSSRFILPSGRSRPLGHGAAACCKRNDCVPVVQTLRYGDVRAFSWNPLHSECARGRTGERSVGYRVPLAGRPRV
uniref:Putative secreted protein n=1 Tax=Anopheles darlingi TaxID=43151 RepID=A0A2M4DG81_ANODA